MSNAYICVNYTHFVPRIEHNMTWLSGFEPWNKCFYKSARAIVKYSVPRHSTVPHGRNNWNGFDCYLVWIKTRTQAWMMGVFESIQSNSSVPSTQRLRDA